MKSWRRMASDEDFFSHHERPALSARVLCQSVGSARGGYTGGLHCASLVSQANRPASGVALLLLLRGQGHIRSCLAVDQNENGRSIHLLGLPRTKSFLRGSAGCECRRIRGIIAPVCAGCACLRELSANIPSAVAGGRAPGHPQHPWGHPAALSRSDAELLDDG